MPTTQELRDRLNEAELVYHELSIRGGVRTVVDQNGERIEFSQTSLSRLSAYIASLKAQLGDQIPGPMQVFI